MGSSRTSKALKNSAVALCFYFLNIVLQFISRKVFISHLGTDLLGLNTTIVSIMNFLNIAEMGISSAIAYSLYKPLANQDTNTVCDIVSLQGFMYRKVAWVISGVSVLLLFIFPLYFNDIPFSILYAYATFIVLLFSALVSYIYNYKQVVLDANQESYKILYSFKGTQLVKILIQILFIVSFDNGYVWWLIIEFLFAIISALCLGFTVKKSAPWLRTSISAGKEAQFKYPVIKVKIKQIFFHKISKVILRELSPIIIYSVASLTTVAIYGNYMLIVSGLTGLVFALFNGIAASVGNLVATSEKENVINVFREFFSSRFLLLSSCAFAIICFSKDFMIIWLKDGSLIFENHTVILLSCIFFLSSTRLLIDTFLESLGMFQDIWAAIVEALLNIFLSYILGRLYGIDGVLIGVLISLIVISFIWKPFFLFTKGINGFLYKYIKMYVIHIIVFGICILSYLIACRYLNFFSGEGYLNLIERFIYFSLFVIVLQWGALYVIEPGMKHFSARMLNLANNKLLHKTE